jgi:flagellum-specific ATP synthase
VSVSLPTLRFIEQRLERLRQAPRSISRGRLKRVTGLLLEVEGLQTQIGGQACIQHETLGTWIDVECIGFDSGIAYFMAFDPVAGLSPGASVFPLDVPHRSGKGYRIRAGIASLPIGPALLGRVVDGLGRPLDGRGGAVWKKSFAMPVKPNPLRRATVNEAFDSGVRAINGLMTIGRGQRVGIFAGSGVGKSVLLSMLTRNCVADVIVLALVGERSREVREFCEEHLNEAARQRAVVVAAPADSSPLARAKGAEYATNVAAWFRDQGKHVVLIVDSLTRFAMAQREMGLALGEVPVARGYPPSVFARIPELVERVGNGENTAGSLTTFYTVLLEGDDVTDPVADAARSVLDGHIFLSRELADAGHYPAIDVEKSISRVMPRVVNDVHVQAARRVKQLVSRYMGSRDMVSMGAYAPGNDEELDLALKKWPSLRGFLRQDVNESISLSESTDQLAAVLAGE